VERPFPPCQAACPVRTDTREYVNLIAWGRFEEALQVIRKVNPFLPSAAGSASTPARQNAAAERWTLPWR
jgi:NADPH-dependent glutamate synthase beta subunit-like oxidoreductase